MFVSEGGAPAFFYKCRFTARAAYNVMVMFVMEILQVMIVAGGVNYILVLF